MDTVVVGVIVIATRTFHNFYWIFSGKNGNL